MTVAGTPAPAAGSGRTGARDERRAPATSPSDPPPARLAEPQAPRQLARVPLADLPALTRRAEELRRAAADDSSAGEPRAPAALQPPHARDSAPPALAAGAPAPAPGAPPTPPGPSAPSTLSAARTPALARTPAAPAPPPPPAGPTGDIDAAALARLTGGTLVDAGPGKSSVSFLGRTTDRQLASAPSGSSATMSLADPPGSATPDAIAIGGEQGPLLIDEIYDRIVKRLRRELLDDRERRGRLIGEGRW